MKSEETESKIADILILLKGVPRHSQQRVLDQELAAVDPALRREVESQLRTQQDEPTADFDQVWERAVRSHL